MKWLGLAIPLALAAMAPVAAAERVTVPRLVEMASQDRRTQDFRDTVTATLGDARIKNGTAYAGDGELFVWAVESASEPVLLVDEVPTEIHRLGTSNLWFAESRLTVHRNHTFSYLVDGKPFGGDVNVPAYGPESYEQPGVPKGTVSPRIIHTSKIYDGMKSEYWVYVPAQYDPKVPTPVMVWNDGGQHSDRNGGSRTQNVVDNLIAQKRIPVMIQVFINPGDIGEATGTKTFDYVTQFSKKTGRTMRDAMRSTEYDTVTDRYPRFLVSEILAEVGQKYNLRKDGYSRAIAGESSGGIAAFNAAWQQPDQFSRVLSRIGTYTSIQWLPGELDGGNIFPFAVRKTPKKNLRIWMSDGCEDLENEHGSWPLQNLQLANSLKMQGYDYHFSFQGGSHSGVHGNAESPLSLTWLWRDYDPAKTSQDYEQEAAEKAKPYFRVRVYNRD
jgi:enterochelin esterase-like enzyme